MTVGGMGFIPERLLMMMMTHNSLIQAYISRHGFNLQCTNVLRTPTRHTKYPPTHVTRHPHTPVDTVGKVVDMDGQLEVATALGEQEHAHSLG